MQFAAVFSFYIFSSCMLFCMVALLRSFCVLFYQSRCANDEGALTITWHAWTLKKVCFACDLDLLGQGAGT